MLPFCGIWLQFVLKTLKSSIGLQPPTYGIKLIFQNTYLFTFKAMMKTIHLKVDYQNNLIDLGEGIDSLSTALKNLQEKCPDFNEGVVYLYHQNPITQFEELLTIIHRKKLAVLRLKAFTPSGYQAYSKGQKILPAEKKSSQIEQSLNSSKAQKIPDFKQSKVNIKESETKAQSSGCSQQNQEPEMLQEQITENQKLRKLGEAQSNEPPANPQIQKKYEVPLAKHQNIKSKILSQSIDHQTVQELKKSLQQFIKGTMKEEMDNLKQEIKQSLQNDVRILLKEHEKTSKQSHGENANAINIQMQKKILCDAAIQQAKKQAARLHENINQQKELIAKEMAAMKEGLKNQIQNELSIEANVRINECLKQMRKQSGQRFEELKNIRGEIISTQQRIQELKNVYNQIKIIKQNIRQKTVQQKQKEFVAKGQALKDLSKQQGHFVEEDAEERSSAIKDRQYQEQESPENFRETQNKKSIHSGEKPKENSGWSTQKKEQKTKQIKSQGNNKQQTDKTGKNKQKSQTNQQKPTQMTIDQIRKHYEYELIDTATHLHITKEEKINWKVTIKNNGINWQDDMFLLDSSSKKHQIGKLKSNQQKSLTIASIPFDFKKSSQKKQYKVCFKKNGYITHQQVGAVIQLQLDATIQQRFERLFKKSKGSKELIQVLQIVASQHAKLTDKQFMELVRNLYK